MRCPNCDTLLGDDVEGWLIARRKKHWICPLCGWFDKDKRIIRGNASDRYGRKII
jgi:rubrerythrin